MSKILKPKAKKSIFASPAKPPKMVSLNPCQKPSNFYFDYLKSIKNVGLVIDAFAGTGVLSMVSAHLGINFLTIEKDKKQFDNLRLRLLDRGFGVTAQEPTFNSQFDTLKPVEFTGRLNSISLQLQEASRVESQRLIKVLLILFLLA